MPESYKTPKANSLLLMQQLGFNVPVFFVISLMGKKYPQIINEENYGIPIQHGISVLKNPLLVSVRCSSLLEDGATNSNAGAFLSFNGVRDLTTIYLRIEEICEDHYQKTGNLDCEIIIQETIVSNFSGVFFADYKQDRAYCEAYYGSCRSIVDGICTPYRSILYGEWQHDFGNMLSKGKFVVHNSSLINLISGIEPGSLLTIIDDTLNQDIRFYNSHLHNESIVYCNRLSPPEKYEELVQHINSTLHINTLFEKYPMGVDIEWGIAPNGELFFFQLRSLTQILPDQFPDSNNKYNVADDTVTINGIAASNGTSTGQIIYSKSTLQLNASTSKILFLEEATIENIDSLNEYSGVISQFGGFLSHLAIVCREKNIPCVSGIQLCIKEGTFVEINGTNGIVRILDKFV